MWNKSIPILQHVSALQDYFQLEQLVKYIRVNVLIFSDVDFHVLILYLNVQTLYVSCFALLCQCIVQFTV